MAPVAAKYKQLRRRMRRSLYYGQNTRMDQLSLPLNQVAVGYFERNAPFDYLDLGFATHLSREGCVQPASLIVALVYLDRLRSSHESSFNSADANDLYLSALLLASKWMEDGGETEYVYNDEWAASANRSLKSVNRMEIQMLNNLDWNLNVTSDEFDEYLKRVEMAAASLEASKRDWTNLTYSEIVKLLHDNHNIDSDNKTLSNNKNNVNGQNNNNNNLWTLFFQPFFAMLGLASMVYTASVISLNYGMTSWLNSASASSKATSTATTTSSTTSSPNHPRTLRFSPSPSSKATLHCSRQNGSCRDVEEELLLEEALEMQQMMLLGGGIGTTKDGEEEPNERGLSSVINQRLVVTTNIHHSTSFTPTKQHSFGPDDDPATLASSTNLRKLLVLDEARRNDLWNLKNDHNWMMTTTPSGGPHLVDIGRFCDMNETKQELLLAEVVVEGDDHNRGGHHNRQTSTHPYPFIVSVK